MAGKKRKLTLLSEFEDVSGELTECLRHAVETKEKNPDADVSAEMTRAAILFIEVRRINREINFASEAAKQLTQESKMKLDQFNLQLQNLEYEKNHLLKEIRRCQEFQSSEKDIDLQPVEEFLATAPSSLTNVSQEEHPHQFMLNRLTHENQERQRLRRELEELEKVKSSLEEQNAAELTALQGMHVELSKLLEATQPIQKGFLPSDLSEQKRHAKLTQLLPTPLYILFSSLVAYQDAFEPTTLEVSIVGDSEEAVRVNADASVLRKSKGRRRGEDDEEMPDVAEQTAGTEGTLEEDDYYLAHPLAVSVVVKPRDGDHFTAALELRFEYLVHLEIMAVTVCGSSETVAEYSPLLVDLFPNDAGLASPNPANQHVLSQGSFKYSQTVPARPYQWVQRLAGLEFISKAGGAPAAGSTVTVVLKLLRARLNAARRLHHQLSQLAEKQLPIAGVSKQFPLKPKSTLEEWEEVPAEYFRTALAKDKGAMSSVTMPPAATSASAAYRHRFFRALFRGDNADGGSVRLRVFVIVSPEYPLRAPVFRLRFSRRTRNGSSSAFDNSLQVMEREVNGFYNELVSEEDGWDVNDILGLQLRRLQLCLDVFLQTDDDVSEEVITNKIAIRPRRGRDRELAFCVNSASRLFNQRTQFGLEGVQE